MKISLDWLNNYLDSPAATDQVERALTEQGLAIESVEPIPDTVDTVLDVEVTSNRSDCLGHVGLAREVAAGLGRTLKLPDCSIPHAGRSDDNASSLTSVINEDLELCRLYTARVIRGVKVGPSPKWLVARLQAIGLRSVNNVVDVTNFVLFELGQPLHAFDMARLDEGRIVVRRAKAGELFEAIDGTRHPLEADMLMIADAKNPVAVAGVMGGVDSEVSDQTTDILLESAIFSPLSVRTTSRRLKLASDSSYRFERGVDPLGVDRASRRAAGLIVELAGGAVAEGVVRVGNDDPEKKTISMRVQRCNMLLGLDLTGSQMMAPLTSLRLEPRLDSATEVITCRVPTFRLDLHREVDLIEEVARLHGLSNVATTPKIHIQARPPQPAIQARLELGQVLVAHGYHETINFSFIKPALGKLFVPEGEKPLMIDNERRKAEPMLRPAIVPSLMACRKANQDVGNNDLRLFETAAVWSCANDDRVIERQRLGMLADAEDYQHAVRDLRGAIDELAERLTGVNQVTLNEAAARNLSAGAVVEMDREAIGWMGLVAPECLKRFDLQTPIVVAELDLDPLIAGYPPDRKVQKLVRFPAIQRDLSVVVDKKVTWEQIEQALRSAEPALLEELRFMGTYRGKPIAKGRKSVSFRMVFRDPQATLRHDQVDPQVAAVVDRLKQKLGAELRR